MTVKISGTMPKDPPAINGLGAHQPAIIEAYRPGEEGSWTGYAVVKLSVKESTDKADGTTVTTLWIDHVEMMDGHRSATAKRMLNDTFNERIAEPGPDAYGERYDGEGSDFLRYGAGLHTTRDLVPEDGGMSPVDPYENPDEAPETHRGQPVERVELPFYSPHDGDPDGDDVADGFEDAERHESESASAS